MAMKMVTVVVFLSMLLWQSTNGQSSGVYFSLNGQNYMNNSIILISEIGETDPDRDQNEGLQCVTDKRSCCYSVPNRAGEWYFPNETVVSIKGSDSEPRSFYRNRGDDGTVNLNRVGNITSPTGQFHCVIPDKNNVNQTLFVCIELELTSINSCTALQESKIQSDGDSGYYILIIGGSIAGAVAVSVIITIPVTVVIFVLVLRYCRKRRFPREHKFPPSAVRYTFRQKVTEQQSETGNHYGSDGVRESSKMQDEYATVQRGAAKGYVFDTEEEYDDIIKPSAGTNYQNQTQTIDILEEEYDDIIAPLSARNDHLSCSSST